MKSFGKDVCLTSVKWMKMATFLTSCPAHGPCVRIKSSWLSVSGATFN